MAEVHEKRKSKRIKINATIKLQKINNNLANMGFKEDEFEVNVINISKDGIAFKSKEFLALNSFYDTKIHLWRDEPFNAIIEIIRMENQGEEETIYGCRFIGISRAEQFRIDVYRIVAEDE